MVSVNVIHYLSQMEIISDELNALLDETNIMQNMADKCDNANAKSAAAIIRRYSAKVNTKVQEYIHALEEVKLVIDAVPKADCRLLLIKRYLQNKTWEQIAEDMNFSLTHIYRLRKKSLELLEEVLKLKV